MSITPVINALNAGELSPQLEGRSDLQKYSSGCRLLENLIIQPYGGATRRPGLKYVAETKDSSKVSRLISFEFNQVQAYHLEFGDQYIRFVKDGAQIEKSSPDAWLTLTAYVIGDFVAESGTTYYCLENHTSGTFATDLAADKWVAQSIYEIPSPYLEADLPKIKFVQSADVMFIVHPDYSPRKLSRLDHDDWTLELFAFKNGPFLDENITDTTITASYPAWVTATDYVIGNHVTVSGDTFIALTDHTSGATNPTPPGNTTDWRKVYQFTGNNTILTASASTFLSSHVGSLWLLRHLREDAAKNGSLAASAGVESEIFPVFGSWRFTTRGTWTAKIEIQRSFDNGATWVTYQVYTSAADFNTNTVGEEIERNVLYKIKRITAGTNAVPWMFNIESTYYEGTVKITTVTSATAAIATVQNPVGSLTATKLWSEGAWSEYRGYPAAVAFFEQRLMFTATNSNPQTVWGSKSGDFANFQPGTLDDDAINYTIGADRVNVIRWMQPQAQLLIGTIAGEWKMGGSDIGEPITPTNVSIRRQSTYGSKDVAAQLVNDVVLFIQRQGRKVREMTLDPANVQDKYVAPDMTVLAEHITESGIKEIAYQQQPDSILWCVREDGAMIGMTYERDQDVVGWHRHSTDGEFESISIIPGSVEDEIAVIVKREIDGSTVRYIEIFSERDWGSDQTDCFFVDSGLTFDGGEAKAITGATSATEIVITSVGHGLLDGQQILIDGVVGMTELNGKVYTVSDKTNDTFKIKDSTSTAYISALGDLSKLDCISFWKLNDDAASTDVLDGFGSNDGTASANTDTLAATGKINGALAFNGTSDYINVGNDVSMQVYDNAVSWSFWIKIVDPGLTEAKFFYMGNQNLSTGDNEGWSIEVERDARPEDVIRWKDHMHDKEFYAAVPGTYMTPGTFHHVCVVRDGLDSSIYFNGVKLILRVSEDTLDDVLEGGFGPYEVLLNRKRIVFTPVFYKSTVDALMMFNRALTADEVAVIYNGGTGTESFGFTDYTSGGTFQRVEDTFTNLAHLEGEECALLADGGTHPNVTVESGSAQLMFFANKVHIGLPYDSNLQPSKVVMQVNGGSSMARRKRIHEVIVKFYRTLNGKIGRDADNLDPIIFGKFTDTMGTAPDLYTGDVRMPFNGDLTNDADIYIRQSDPLPMTVLALMLKMEVTE